MQIHTSRITRLIYPDGRQPLGQPAPYPSCLNPESGVPCASLACRGVSPAWPAGASGSVTRQLPTAGTVQRRAPKPRLTAQGAWQLDSQCQKVCEESRGLSSRKVAEARPLSPSAALPSRQAAFPWEPPEAPAGQCWQSERGRAGVQQPPAVANQATGGRR